jgi:hypothetical protein
MDFIAWSSATSQRTGTGSGVIPAPGMSGEGASRVQIVKPVVRG